MIFVVDERRRRAPASPRARDDSRASSSARRFGRGISRATTGNANAPCSPRRCGNSTSFGSVDGGESGEPSRGEGLAERASTRRAIRRWTKGTTGTAWRQWTSHVDRERVKVRAARTHAAIKSAVARERTLRGSWTSWREHAAYYRRASALVSKAYAKTCRLQKQSVFDQWWDFVREVEARKETLKRCVTSKRLLTTWFLDWYWRAFEGDISSALGAITDSTEDVIDTVYGGGRGVDRGVFQQWQMLGSSSRR